MAAFGSLYITGFEGPTFEIEAPGRCEPEQVILLITKVKDIFQRLGCFPLLSVPTWPEIDYYSIWRYQDRRKNQSMIVVAGKVEPWDP
jgi:hypothetical protein